MEARLAGGRSCGRLAEESGMEGEGRLDQKDVESTGDQSIIRTLCYTHTFLVG